MLASNIAVRHDVKSASCEKIGKEYLHCQIKGNSHTITRILQMHQCIKSQMANIVSRLLRPGFRVALNNDS